MKETKQDAEEQAALLALLRFKPKGKGVNGQLFDDYVVRATDLQKLTAGQRTKVIAFLQKLEKDLVIELAQADLPGYQMTAYRETRLRTLLDSTKATIRRAYADISKVSGADMRTLVQAESQYVQKSINDLVGVDLASTSLSPAQLNAIADDTMIMGAPSSEWWSRQSDAVAQKFADVIRLGVAKGDTNSEIRRSALMQVDSLAATNADALVRTSVQTISSQARVDSMQANDDVVSAIQQHSTLDSRTTLICIAYSGQRYTNDDEHRSLDNLPFVNDGGSKNGIPRHWGCRSYFIPIVKSWADLSRSGLKTGGRPAVDIDAYFRSRLARRGFTEKQIAATVRNAQASMDGSVPDSLNYEQWLRTKPEAFQIQQLGPTRYKLWKQGKLPFTHLVDRSGEPMSVEDLLKKTA